MSGPVKREPPKQFRLTLLGKQSGACTGGCCCLFVALMIGFGVAAGSQGAFPHDPEELVWAHAGETSGKITCADWTRQGRLVAVEAKHCKSAREQFVVHGLKTDPGAGETAAAKSGSVEISKTSPTCDPVRVDATEEGKLRWLACGQLSDAHFGMQPTSDPEEPGEYTWNGEAFLNHEPSLDVLCEISEEHFEALCDGPGGGWLEFESAHPVWVLDNDKYVAAYEGSWGAAGALIGTMLIALSCCLCACCLTCCCGWERKAVAPSGDVPAPGAPHGAESADDACRPPVGQGAGDDEFVLGA